MHYSKLINVSTIGGSRNNNESAFMQEIVNLVRTHVKNKESQTSNNKTELTENEACEIAEFLCECHDKYFSNFPLSENLSKNFIWNIPREMYDIFSYLREMDDEKYDIINPIMYLYIFCAENPFMMLTEFMDIVCDMWDTRKDFISKFIEKFKEENKL